MVSIDARMGQRLEIEMSGPQADWRRLESDSQRSMDMCLCLMGIIQPACC